ncbi:ferritin-like domain-containing protein [Tepidanaerobacter sp. GT38]|uniref:ferritin-like domain-containing protein n=1 Tax=Tepidanaerobacter sp. GT38 TaxID=2722793 RepID=UPI001F39510F|nr:ferritin-like domain-containing protein [Tepidanaerobacter sp. GT38]MCG1012368.1 ferritin-like domain-containing protein [Tepidanaerobacter sp. GT38]
MYQNIDLQIPNLPVLGPTSFGKIIQYIYKSIVDEATAAEFYGALLRQAPDALHMEFIQHARQDELDHLQAFIKLYRHYTGKMPQYAPNPVQYPSYKAGILQALKSELEAAEFYRDVQLSTTDQLIRDTFYFAMVDELEHATQFSTLYHTL